MIYQFQVSGITLKFVKEYISSFSNFMQVLNFFYGQIGPEFDSGALITNGRVGSMT